MVVSLGDMYITRMWSIYLDITIDKRTVIYDITQDVDRCNLKQITCSLHCFY